MTVPAPHSSDHLVAASGKDLSPPAGPTLLQGAVLRPQTLQWNGVRYTGAEPAHIDTQAAQAVPGIVAVVVRGSFMGVVASQLNQALHARDQIDARWNEPERDQAPTVAAAENQKTYTWSASQAANTWSIGLFDTDGTEPRMTVWTCTAHTELLRAEVAAVCGLPENRVQVLPNGAHHAEGYDSAVDAALLAQHVPGRPVKVASAAQAATRMVLQLSTDNARHIEKLSQYPLRRPSVAALLCGASLIGQGGFTQAAMPYGLLQQSIEPANAPLSTTPDASADAALVFARESFFDETCREQGLDPVRARLERVDDPTGQTLIRSVAERAKWFDQTSPPMGGRGFAYSHTIDHEHEPPRAVWSAWIAEIQVGPDGAVDLTRVTVGHSTESLPQRNDAETIENQVRHAAERLLPPAAAHDQWGESFGGSFALKPAQVDLVTPEGRSQVSTPMAWNDQATLPAAAAIANAIFDATGTRLRDAPFDGRLLQQAVDRKLERSGTRKLTYGVLGGIAAAAAGLLVSALPWRSAIAPVQAVDTSVYSAQAIERGRLVALAGDCMVCHTAEGGTENTGGRPLDTPFGVVYTTNITPDPETGIGAWSYKAFERAMREGIHRDGRHLYPVFPYTSFAKLSDGDMQSLYAYLMTREPVKASPPKTQLAFPFSARPLMASWNTLFHKNERFEPDPSKTTLWNRGAYLVQGAGHCTACHSPRNTMGAEKSGDSNFLAGGFADGWEAPPLNELSRSPIAWTEESLFSYLRTGNASTHGVASGPMAPVVEGLAQLPESDVRAMAHYLASLARPAAETEPAALTAARLEDASRNNRAVMTLPGENLFEGACAVCHDAREGPPLFGARPSLALNTNLHSDHPDNVIQVLMHGISDPGNLGLGNMPGFKDSLNDQQMKDLVQYLRARFAPDKPAWEKVDEKIAAIRQQPGHP